jgi:hypothetical protein
MDLEIDLPDTFISLGTCLARILAFMMIRDGAVTSTIHRSPLGCPSSRLCLENLVFKFPRRTDDLFPSTDLHFKQVVMRSHSTAEVRSYSRFVSHVA